MAQERNIQLNRKLHDTSTQAIDGHKFMYHTRSLGRLKWSSSKVRVCLGTGARPTRAAAMTGGRLVSTGICCCHARPIVRPKLQDATHGVLFPAIVVLDRSCNSPLPPQVAARQDQRVRDSLDEHTVRLPLAQPVQATQALHGRASRDHGKLAI